MKKFRIISLILVLAMLLMAVPAVQAQGNSQQNVLDEIPYTDYDSTIAPYNYTSMELYTADNAPTEIAGFTGYAMKLTGSGGGIGITLDFSDQHIPLSKILTLNIRVFYPEKTNQVRVTANKGGAYALQHGKDAAYAGTQWQELKIAGDKLAYNGYINSSGELGKFCLLVRLTDNNENSFYIDYVTVTTTDDIKDEIPYTPNDIADLSAYIGNPAEFYTESEAAAAGVPAGYSGYVIKVTNKNQTGLALDYTDQHIAASDIKAIDFRIYYTASEIKSDGIRLRDTSNSWIMYAPVAAGQWQTLHIEDSTTINKLCTNGELGKFALCFRFSSDTAAYTCYVDCVSVTRYSEVKEEIPYTDSNVPDFDAYVGTMNIYNELSGPDAGVPAGYSGYVMKLTRAYGVGITLDYTDKNIARSDIQSISFRIYYETGAVKSDGVRVKEDSSGSHWGLYAPSEPGQWTTLTLTNSSKDSEGNNLFDKLCPSGILGKIGLCFRFNDNTTTYTCYVDSVTVKLWGDVKDEIPFTTNDIPDFTQYVSTTLNDFYDETTGAAAGIPAGYTGYVLKLTGTNQTGMAFDFTDKNIARADLLSIEFRVYYPDGLVQSGNGLRVKENTSGVTWALYPPSDPGKWTTLTVTSSDTDTQGNNLFDKLCPSGILGKVGLGFRLTGTGSCYVDYVRVNVKIPVSYDDVKAEIPYVTNDVPDFTQYVSSPLNDVYTEANGAAAGVPAGYTGYVMKLTNSAATGLAVDFTDQQIPLSVINAVNIRMYYPDAIKEDTDAPGIRLKYNQSGTTWKLYHPENPGQWTVLSVTDRSVLAKLCDGDGYLSKFALGFRFNDSVSHSCYIDYVSVDIKPDDGVAPVVTYNGPTDITTSANKTFVINASAYDAYEERNIPIDYVWSSNPFDANNKLVEGVYTCTISATDYYGNKSAELVLNITVGPADTNAPVINFDVTEIYSIAGCAPVVNVSATDDYDDVTVEITWSVNALDARGRLTNGTHTLNLRAVDLTGNVAEKNVTVYAGAEFITTKPVEYES